MVAANGAVLAFSTQITPSSKVSALTNNNTFIKAGLLSTSSQVCQRQFSAQAHPSSGGTMLKRSVEQAQNYEAEIAA